MMSGTEGIYYYDATRLADKGDQVHSQVISKGQVTIPEGTERQLLIEVFFDPQLYDIELLFESKEASEVRAHMYSGKSNVDVSQFKGAKRIFVEAEPGVYSLSIVAKLPGLTDSTRQYAAKYIEFQLYALAATTIPSRITRPASLNYFGLLGPQGKGFGQFVYHLPEVILDAREFIDLEFNLTGHNGVIGPGGTAIDIQATELDGRGDQLDIAFREITVEETLDKDGKPVAANFVEKHPHASKHQDGWEDGISYEALEASDLKTNTLYRVRLGNRDPAEMTVSSLKVVITERFASEKEAPG